MLVLQLFYKLWTTGRLDSGNRLLMEPRKLKWLQSYGTKLREARRALILETREYSVRSAKNGGWGLRVAASRDRRVWCRDFLASRTIALHCAFARQGKEAVYFGYESSERCVMSPRVGLSVEFIFAELSKDDKDPRDQRVTSPLARFLRKHSIDEIPQL